MVLWSIRFIANRYCIPPTKLACVRYWPLPVATTKRYNTTLFNRCRIINSDCSLNSISITMSSLWKVCRLFFVKGSADDHLKWPVHLHFTSKNHVWFTCMYHVHWTYCKHKKANEISIWIDYNQENTKANLHSHVLITIAARANFPFPYKIYTSIVTCLKQHPWKLFSVVWCY